MFVFAQQVGVWGQKGDVLFTLSTSGNSKNCVYAAMVAKAKRMSVVALLGGSGGTLKAMADASVVAPEKETFKVQELHLPIYHCLCAMLEEEFF
jgi:D-sedoheptulose 7-phosphate isomerase